MTRVLTIQEYVLEQLNRRARERGEDVEIVFNRPRPQLAASEGNVIKLEESK